MLEQMQMFTQNFDDEEAEAEERESNNKPAKEETKIGAALAIPNTKSKSQKAPPKVTDKTASLPCVFFFVRATESWGSGRCPFSSPTLDLGTTHTHRTDAPRLIAAAASNSAGKFGVDGRKTTPRCLSLF